ncbi:MAG: DNA topoisomerase [Candidatus Woesearchaeota archaeon]|jgi:DNA topoisomerase-1
MKLVIIESPGKISSLKKILGPGYDVIATFGHCVDLGKKLSVDVKDDFKPTYEILPNKKDVIKDIKKKALKAEAVFLSTDSDREGEIISKHIYDILKPTIKAPIYRASFTQITKNAVLEAINNPREIDQNLVGAQTARRILDRLCGYKTSFPTKQATGGTSAGRVQSVALRILAEREKEIKGFVPKEYWEIVANLLSPKKEEFSVKLDVKIEVRTEKDALEIYEKVRNGTPVVKEVLSSIVEVKPYPPFATQALCAAAKSYFGWSSEKTMKIAQDLYEGMGSGHGFITYMRTDSYMIEPGTILALRNHISNNFGNNYIPDKPNFYKNKASAQAGHEAVRPVSVSDTSVSSGDHNKLYDLIWKKTAASQSVPSKEQRVKVIIDIAGYDFTANGNVILFDGWKKIFNYVNSESNILPALSKGDICFWNN